MSGTQTVFDHPINMRLFLLFSTLVTAAALSAKEALDELWTYWLAGENDKFPPYYADGATVNIDPELGDYPILGRHTLGDDLSIVDVLKQFSDNIVEVAALDYKLFEQDANHVISDTHIVAKSKNDGNRYVWDFIIKVDTNADGKITNQEWLSYNTEKIDAASVIDRLYNYWKAGNVNAFKENCEKDIEMTVASESQVGGAPGLSGTYVGHDGFDNLVKEFAHFKDDLSTWKYNIHGGGNSATVDFTAERIMPNGARYLVTSYQSWTVNDLGKVVSGVWVMQSFKPLNARAAWDKLMTEWATGGADAVSGFFVEDYYHKYGGNFNDFRQHWPDSNGPFIPSEYRGRDIYIKHLGELMIQNPLLELNQKFLSQRDNSISFRQEIVQAFGGGVHVRSVAHNTYLFDENMLIKSCISDTVKVELDGAAAKEGL